MTYWRTYSAADATVGRRVLSRPDSRGEAMEGELLEVRDGTVTVRYKTLGHPVLLYRDGRWCREFETTVDIILIES